MADDAPAGPDWTDQVADRIESVVGTIRDKTTVPAIKIVRAIVFGLVAAVLGLTAFVLTVIALVRVLDVYIPLHHPAGRSVWITYVGLGAIFLAVGAFCWSKRTKRA